MTEIEGISYTVDANTAGLITLKNEVQKTSDSAVRNLKRIDGAADESGASMRKLSATAEGVKSSFDQVGARAGQAGIQIQQFVGQVQGGTSAMTALSQQAADIGIVMGAPLLGVVVALAAAIGGTLYNSINKATGAMSSLPEELQKYLKAIEAQYAQLDEVSRAEFAQAEIGKVATAYQKSAEEVDRLTKRLEKLKTTGLIGEDISLGTSLPEQIKLTRQELEKSKARAADLTQILNKLSEVTATGLATEKVTEGLTTSTDRASQLATQIQIAIVKLTEGELAARKMAAAQYLGLTNAEQLPTSLDESITRLYQLEEAQKRVNDQKRAERELQREIRGELDKELQAELAAMAAKDKDRKYIGDIMASGDGSQAARVAADAEARIKMLQDIAARDTSQAEAAAEAIILVEQQKQDELTRIAAEAAEKRNQFTIQATQTTLGAFGDLFGNLADAAKEGGRDTFQQWKNLASAQAAISTALAFTNTLANPLIPYPLNLALAGSVAALGAVQIAKIQSQQYSGRLYGGPVQAGGMYPITEDGRPEILKQGSRQYLLPGTGGEVISNKDMQAGGGGGSITINYNPTIYAQDADFEAIMAGQPEAVLNAVRIGLASEGRTL
jgi:hypothetical protein